jgi:hypothetical protein
VLSWLEDNLKLLEILLWRENVKLTDLRRRIFLSQEPRYDSIKETCAVHNFYLDFVQFHSLLKKRPDLLQKLYLCRDLLLVMRRALHHCPEADFSMGELRDPWSYRTQMRSPNSGQTSGSKRNYDG